MENNHQTQPNITEEKIIPLLEERLLVDRQKHKVGEIVVRKKIETHFVQVPVRREVLVVEKVGREVEKVVEIDLSEGKVNGRGVEFNSIPNSESIYHVYGEFSSPQQASTILETIGQNPNHGCVRVKVELTVTNPQLQKIYQQAFEFEEAT